MSNIDYRELYLHYQHAFQNSNGSQQLNLSIGTIIRVRKFGRQYHNACVIDRDYSIIKIRFFERKSQQEIWIHSDSSIIESTRELSLSKKFQISSSSSSSSKFDNDTVRKDHNLSRLRKRKINANNINEGTCPSIAND